MGALSKRETSTFMGDIIREVFETNIYLEICRKKLHSNMKTKERQQVYVGPSKQGVFKKDALLDKFVVHYTLGFSHPCN